MRAFLLLLLTAMSTVAAAQSAIDLPDIGSPAEAALPQSDEYRIGLMIVRGLRDQGQLLEDPEANEYVESLGTRLAAQAGENGQKFQFFIVRDPRINAFALPGGFIGVNSGTVLAAADEAQLAGVIAHEIAHVTQRHIARTIKAQSRQSLASAAAILAAILIGAATGAGDAVQAGIAVAQGSAAQQQINFTRANEYEADRVGIGFLAAAGFDPTAMPEFFEIMGRRTGLAGANVPEFFQTHPVTANRIAESRNRATQFPKVRRAAAPGFALARERLRVLGTPPEQDAGAYYATRRAESQPLSLGERYGEALALMNRPEPGPGQAVQILQDLLSRNEGVTMLHGSLAQAQIASGDTAAGLATFARAITLFPRNVPLAVRYADALIAAQRAKEAHTLLLDVFNNVVPTPAQIRLTALAASAAGDTGDAYYYMSEYHIGSGDLPLAAQQLELALAAPNLTTVQRERFRARLDEIRDFLALEGRRSRQARAVRTEGGGGP